MNATVSSLFKHVMVVNMLRPKNTYIPQKNFLVFYVMLLYSLAKSDVVEGNHHMILQGYNAVLTVVQDHPYVPTKDSTHHLSR